MEGSVGRWPSSWVWGDEQICLHGEEASRKQSKATARRKGLKRKMPVVVNSMSTGARLESCSSTYKLSDYEQVT